MLASYTSILVTEMFVPYLHHSSPQKFQDSVKEIMHTLRYERLIYLSYGSTALLTAWSWQILDHPRVLPRIGNQTLVQTNVPTKDLHQRTKSHGYCGRNKPHSQGRIRNFSINKLFKVVLWSDIMQLPLSSLSVIF